MATSGETQTDTVKADKGDSKDFVEHLRTVHFTLVTVCLALIVILQFPFASFNSRGNSSIKHHSRCYACVERHVD